MKPRPDKWNEWDLRVTPVDQVGGVGEEGWASLVSEENEKLLVCKEGGTTECKLHYHAYFYTKMSKSHLYKQLSRLAGGVGNPYYSVRMAHEGTIGYVVKGKDVEFRYNYTDTLITQYFQLSDQYRKNVEAKAKRKSRERKSILSEVIGQIRSEGEPEGRTIAGTFDRIYEIYHQKEQPLPSRSILETAIINLQQHSVVRQYYLKNLLSW